MTVMAGQPAVTALRARSFEEFFDAEYERLLRVLYLATGDRHEAEDLAQEAFVRAFERWDHIQQMSNPRAYVYRIALNLRRSRFRRLAVAARRLVLLQAAREPDPIAETDERDAIRRALATLPDGQREAVILVEWLGLTDEQAGLILGVAPVTVRVRISRARAELKERLERIGDD